MSNNFGITQATTETANPEFDQRNAFCVAMLQQEYATRQYEALSENPGKALSLLRGILLDGCQGAKETRLERIFTKSIEWGVMDNPRFREMGLSAAAYSVAHAVGATGRAARLAGGDLLGLTWHLAQPNSNAGIHHIPENPKMLMPVGFAVDMLEELTAWVLQDVCTRHYIHVELDGEIADEAFTRAIEYVPGTGCTEQIEVGRDPHMSDAGFRLRITPAGQSQKHCDDVTFRPENLSHARLAKGTTDTLVITDEQGHTHQLRVLSADRQKSIPMSVDTPWVPV